MVRRLRVRAAAERRKCCAIVTISCACASDMVISYHLVKCYSIIYDDMNTIGDDMPERTDWEEKAKSLLRAEMARKSVTYAQLVEKLAMIGIDDNERNLRNKVSRGKFTAGFFLQCLYALQSSQLHLD